MKEAPSPVPGAFSRIEMLVGPEGIARLRAARVAVFGLGGVGSFAVEALARSGVGFLRIVDFDLVQASNLNRQVIALSTTLGRPKVEVAAERVLAINPAAQVDARRAFFCASDAGTLLAGDLDWVIDAIDGLNSKINLISAALARGIRVVSAMGAANRTDPSRIRVSDISETRECPLAAKVRRRLRKMGIESGVTAVWSGEPPHAPLVPPPEPGSEDCLVRGRLRSPLPSMAPLPGIFGLVAANVVLGSYYLPRNSFK